MSLDSPLGLPVNVLKESSRIVFSLASSVVALSLAVLLNPIAFTARSIECRELPANLQVEADLRPTVVQMIGRSPTLRRQCRIISTSTTTRVSVTISVEPLPAGARARSFARRYRSGLLVVEVRIPPASRDFAELLAHELEHVTELIENVDVRAQGNAETDRARNAGIAAAAELAAGPSHVARPWRALARFARHAVRR